MLFSKNLINNNIKNKKNIIFNKKNNNKFFKYNKLKTQKFVYIKFFKYLNSIKNLTDF